jgi:DNA-binding MarR family transcriptional regulator
VAQVRDAQLYALLRVAGSIESHVEAKLSEIGLSLPKLAALHRLVEAGDSLPLGHLAERLACVKSNVTQLVDRMEADGLVSRELDPTDRRSRLAVITDRGRTLYRQGVRVREQSEAQLFAVLSPVESAQLAALLAKLGGRPGRCPDAD